MELAKLEEKFREVTAYDTNEDILVVIFYGSRVTKSNKPTSDLDVLIVSNKKGNFKKGFLIDDIKIDCQVYGIDSIYDAIYEKKVMSNEYFRAVLQNGLVLKNENKTIELIERYMANVSKIKPKKRIIRSSSKKELITFYEEFLKSQDDYSYFNLVEIIRKNYHYLKNFSYINNLKAAKIYSAKEAYENDYCLNLPQEDFIACYLKALQETGISKRMMLIKELMGFLDISLEPDVFERKQDYFKVYTANEMKMHLLTFYNKIASVDAGLKSDLSMAKVNYYLVLKEMADFGKILMWDDEIKKQYDELFAKARQENNIVDGILHLWEIFHLIENGYHFDYDNYMLRL